jgi:hypothetical protein
MSGLIVKSMYGPEAEKLSMRFGSAYSATGTKSNVTSAPAAACSRSAAPSAWVTISAGRVAVPIAIVTVAPSTLLYTTAPTAPAAAA